ncbi:MAG: hypothetical protein V6Z86_07655 [Hyphomicrobiales bacterium]
MPGFVEDARRRTAIAENIDLSPILARYRREQGLADEIVKDHTRELIRFLALSATALNRKRSYGMMGTIDKLWHTFVIFTREYAGFCDKVAGRFIHHVPETEDKASAATIDGYLDFLADYETVLGETPPVAYWPSPKSLSRRPGMEMELNCGGCSGCGHYGCSACAAH